MPDIAQKFVDELSRLISTFVPILLKKLFTCLSGGKMGTGPFLNDINGNGIALIIFIFFLTIFLS